MITCSTSGGKEHINARAGIADGSGEYSSVNDRGPPGYQHPSVADPLFGEAIVAGAWRRCN